ncbi:ATP-binding protein [Leptolyngbya sp. FACHB-17]|uniref:ATP-binding protein n=1 Tax=unclassified Leptolyngbya TaxID=2650499 RepID=UPI0032206976
MIALENLHGLLPLLQRLDARLAQAVAIAESEFSTEDDPYRGLHIDSTEAERLLARKSGTPLFPPDLSSDFPPDLVTPGSRLATLQHTFGLSDFDLELVAIAIAPELDRRYDRLYAYLQDDIRCKRPSVDLALNLLCASVVDKFRQRVRFAADAPLIQSGLMHLIPDANQPNSTLLGRELHLDDQVIRFLLHQPGLDQQLTPFCQLIEPRVALDEPPLPVNIQSILNRLKQPSPLRLYFQGRDRPSQQQVAVRLASAVATPLLIVDLPHLIQTKVGLEPTLKRVLREAQFQGALLYLDGLDALQTEEYRVSHAFLLRILAAHQGITILAGEQAWKSQSPEPLGIVTLAFPMPNFGQRRQNWQQHLNAAGISLDPHELDALADRFRLTSVQIADAVSTAVQTAMLNPQPLDLFMAARAQAGQGLSTLARKIEPIYGWDDIILPADPLAQLKELCNQATYQHVVYGDWGFGNRLSLGKGLNVLFSGLPGTGKTMGAEVIARELQLDLYKIDLSQIISKYIGETEKNLDRIFTAAANSNAILLFDEADALFGKRSEVQDSHDRYANIEIGYLLQKMEEYEGIAILTTNLRSSLDDAFVRRLRFMIDFPLPNEHDRLCIWERIFPAATPRSPDVDLSAMARRFEISGANIRNIALAAAFLAASEGGVITMTHLIRATQREYQKMGKLLIDDWH